MKRTRLIQLHFLAATEMRGGNLPTIEQQLSAAQQALVANEDKLKLAGTNLTAAQSEIVTLKASIEEMKKLGDVSALTKELTDVKAELVTAKADAANLVTVKSELELANKGLASLQKITANLPAAAARNAQEILAGLGHKGGSSEANNGHGKQQTEKATGFNLLVEAIAAGNTFSGATN